MGSNQDPERVTGTCERCSAPAGGESTSCPVCRERLCAACVAACVEEAGHCGHPADELADFFRSLPRRGRVFLWDRLAVQLTARAACAGSTL